MADINNVLTKKRTLDLNTAARPTLDVTLQDENHTTISVEFASEGLVNELQQMSPEMLEVMKSGNQEGIADIYDLAAKLINCNRNFFTTTGEELRTKYNLDLVGAALFFSAYMDFINEVIQAKN